jgi:hypothetical protein
MTPTQYASTSSIRTLISSTFEDLIEYRDAVSESIHNLGTFAASMVRWPSDDDYKRCSPADSVAKADLLFVIVAHKYGFIPEGHDRSVVEIVYNAACEANIPVLAFIIDELQPWPPKYLDLRDLDKLNTFKETLRRKHAVKQFTTPNHLAQLVTEFFTSFVSKRTGCPVIYVSKQRHNDIRLTEASSHSNA